MTLQAFWFWLIAILWSGYFLLEGFDFGVGMLLPWLARPGNERDREVMFEAIGPVWDGNEVWLVVAGGATFAAFPAWYATLFSGFYIALLLVLVLLIVRVVSFEWREKSEDSRWRSVWLWANTVGSVGAPLIWGVALANFIHGVPLNSSHDYAGNFFDLFSAYTLLGGIAVVLLFAFHGASYLVLRTVGDLCARAALAARRLALFAAPPAVAFVVWTVIVAQNRNSRGALPTAIVAAVSALAVLLAVLLARSRRSGWGFAMTGVGVVGIVMTIFTGLYPRVLVSHPTFANSLTIANAASGHYALKVMTIMAVILTPVVLVYQGWTYHVFRQRLGGEPVGAGRATVGLGGSRASPD